MLNIFLCDVSLILNKTYFVRYGDDNTTYTKTENIDQVIRTIKEIFIPHLKWCKYIKMKLNSDKSSLLLIGNKD